MDQSKKTMRHFYCRDVLWETFEQMANDFDCSIDYLINEAMRFYARSKNYQAGISSQNLPQAPANGPQLMPASKSRPHATSIPPAPPQAMRPASVMPLTPHPTPAFRAPRSSSPLSSPRVSPEPAASAPTLFLLFNGQRVAIDKEQFIIGRGSKSSYLAIKDGNISRKHAAIIRRNGLYYIKDLGSTNGIDYKGMRIDNKRIDEGDVFHICDYELRFTYR